MMKSVSIALLVGVVAHSFSQPVLAAETVKYKNEKVLYAFGTGGDGNQPYDVPIKVNGIMYGTTDLGGANDGGAVYSFDPTTGTEKVLYSFCSQQNCTDGETPIGPLLNVNGTLYGTTAYGGSGDGSAGFGVIFAINLTTGAETLAYTFTGGTDGGSSHAGLTELNGTLYGTTAFGGATGNGTVFTFDPTTGAVTAIYSFGSSATDGTNPDGGLIAVNGKLYGMTSNGGDNNNGTVFAVNPKTGKEKVLHYFQGGSGDGANPGSAGLAYAKGMLYGTTNQGGAYCEGGNGGCGTVFSVDPKTGTETVLWSFGNGTDGQYPAGAGVISVKGTLYGTTYFGGASGAGTVFGLDPKTDAETVVYSFTGGTDGGFPLGGLTRLAGKIYGTTQYAGANNVGTLFVLEK